MSYYRHKKLRNWSLSLLAWLLRSLAQLICQWPLIALALLIVFPISPHMRWQYTYEQRGLHRQYIACEYLGVRGLVQYVGAYGTCPFIALIDRRSEH